MLTFSSSLLKSSAVKECSIKARFLEEIPNSSKESNIRIIQIEILSAEFKGGHSAGTNCDLLANSKLDILLKGNSKKKFKSKEVLNLIHTKVFFHDSEHKPKSSETWELVETFSTSKN